MAFEELGRTLSSLDVTAAEIQEAYVFKFGAILLAEGVQDRADGYGYTALSLINTKQSWTFPLDASVKIREALGKHPNVFKVERLSSTEEAGVSSGQPSGMLVEGPLFRAEINIPRARQRYQDMDCTERFTVLCNGSYFGAYAKIFDFPILSNIGHEFRVLAEKQIEQETRYKVPSFGPSPIWTDIVLARTKSDIAETVQEFRSVCRNGNVFIVIGNNVDVPRMMEYVFHLAKRYWSGFYRLALERTRMIHLDVEIQNRFQAASEIVQHMGTAPAWKVLPLLKEGTGAGTQLAKIHELVVKYDMSCWNYDNERREYLSRGQEVPHFGGLRQTTSRICRRDFRLPPSIQPALEFLEKQIEVTRNIRSLLFASLAGALAGAVITGLLELLKH